MKLRVGRIPFLVCAPFFHDFLGRETQFSPIEFVDAPPRVHCAGLKEGSIHLSPASSIAFAQNPGAYVLSPDICTSCSFEVRSVKLFSKYPIENLHQKTVKLTAQSMTSVNLLKILLQERFKITPKYADGLMESKDEACLLIGDQALEENEKNRFAFNYDLGTLWADWQHAPFVFGAWIISKQALQKDLEQTLKNYLNDTLESIEKFKQNKTQALDKWLKYFPVNLPRDVIENYYTSLDYRFTSQRKSSLKLFYELAKKLNLTPAAPELEFFEK